MKAGQKQKQAGKPAEASPAGKGQTALSSAPAPSEAAAIELHEGSEDDLGYESAEVSARARTLRHHHNTPTHTIFHANTLSTSPFNLSLHRPLTTPRKQEATHQEVGGRDGVITRQRPLQIRVGDRPLIVRAEPALDSMQIGQLMPGVMVRRRATNAALPLPSRPRCLSTI